MEERGGVLPPELLQLELLTSQKGSGDGLATLSSDSRSPLVGGGGAVGNGISEKHCSKQNRALETHSWDQKRTGRLKRTDALGGEGQDSKAHEKKTEKKNEKPLPKDMGPY